MRKRNLYTDKIDKYLNTPVVKDITGMRRVGKSYFLKLIIANLREQGVTSERAYYYQIKP